MDALTISKTQGLIGNPFSGKNIQKTRGWSMQASYPDESYRFVPLAFELDAWSVAHPVFSASRLVEGTRASGDIRVLEVDPPSEL